LGRLTIKDLELNDLVILERNNNIPSLFNGPFRLIKSIEQDGNLIGAFWVRATIEPTLIFRSDIGKLSRARALDEAIKYLNDKVPEQLGISDCLLAVEDQSNSSYINYLKKNYNFQELGKTLRLIRSDG
jgi:hypothetical protein